MYINTYIYILVQIYIYTSIYVCACVHARVCVIVYVCMCFVCMNSSLRRLMSATCKVCLECTRM